MKKIAAATMTAFVITQVAPPVGVSLPASTTPMPTPAALVATQEPTAQLVPEVTPEVVPTPSATQPALVTSANPSVPVTSPATPLPTMQATPTPNPDKPLIQSEKVGYVFENSEGEEVNELTADGKYSVTISVDLDKMAKDEVLYLATEGMSFDLGIFLESILANREGYPIAAVDDVTKEAAAPLLRIRKLELPADADQSGYGRAQANISIKVDEGFAAQAVAHSKPIQPHLGILSENPADEIAMLQPYAATKREKKPTKVDQSFEPNSRNVSETAPAAESAAALPEPPAREVPAVPALPPTDAAAQVQASLPDEDVKVDFVAEAPAVPEPEAEKVSAVADQQPRVAPTDVPSMGEQPDLVNTVEDASSGGNALDGAAPTEHPAATRTSDLMQEAKPEEGKIEEAKSQQPDASGIVNRAMNAAKQSISGLVGSDDKPQLTMPSAPAGEGTPITDGIKPQDRPAAKTPAPSSNVDVNNTSSTSPLKPEFGAAALGLVIAVSVLFVVRSIYLSRARGRHS